MQAAVSTPHAGSLAGSGTRGSPSGPAAAPHNRRSAILLTAIYVLEDFGNPLLIAGRYTVLPTQAYGLISGFGDFAGASVVT